MPTTLKVMTGETRRERLNRDEPEAPQGGLRMPRGLSATAKAEWQRIVGALVALGIDSAVDQSSLEEYVAARERRLSARRKWQREGMVKTIRGKPVKHPAVSAEEKAADQCRMWLVEFGLTPSARSRIVAKPKQTKKAGISKYLG